MPGGDGGTAIAGGDGVLGIARNDSVPAFAGGDSVPAMAEGDGGPAFLEDDGGPAITREDSGPAFAGGDAGTAFSVVVMTVNVKSNKMISPPITLKLPVASASPDVDGLGDVAPASPSAFWQLLLPSMGLLEAKQEKKNII